jgi:hypothetical protein
MKTEIRGRKTSEREGRRVRKTIKKKQRIKETDKILAEVS